MKTVLTIAGFDPTAGAGVLADVLTFSAFGVRGLAAVTAVTAQGPSIVRAVEPMRPAILKRQIEAAMDGKTPDAVKIGMLATADIAAALERLIKEKKFKNIVLDPVIRSSSGYPLLEKKGMAALRRLIALATVVTPNTCEAALLTGVDIGDTADAKEAARRLHSMGAGHVVITGGHIKGAPIDMLYDGKSFSYFKGRRIRGGRARLHGTGCLFSSAVAAGLAKGRPVKKAVKDAKRHVEETIRAR